MLFLPLSSLDETFWSETFPQMYDTTDGDNFPGFVGSNHAGPNTRGPLKSDWTKPCPLDWTAKERDEKCVSLQEAIWGTETLKRLEAIKKAVDPDYMLDCYGCVGNNNRPAHDPDDQAGSDGSTTDETPTTGDSSSGSSAPTVGTSFMTGGMALAVATLAFTLELL